MSGGMATCALVDPAALYDVVAGSATFQTMQPNGDPWDAGGGAPDAQLCWYDDINQAPVACTPERADTFMATFTETLKAGIRGSQLMDVASNAAVCLFDVDAISNDIAGCVYARFTAEEIHSGQKSITLVSEGTSIGNASFVIRFVAR